MAITVSALRAINLAAARLIGPGQAVGTFTLHGVTRTISPSVTVVRGMDGHGHESLHLQAVFVVLLSDYRIRTPRFLFFSVRQEHSVSVDAWAVAGNRT